MSTLTIPVDQKSFWAQQDRIDDREERRAAMMNEKGDLLFTGATRPEGPQHDTYEISTIYLQRPICLASLKFSVWFCQAHDLQDWDLLNAASLGDCKQQLIDKKYVFLSLEPLKAFNKKWEKQKVYTDGNGHQTHSDR